MREKEIRTPNLNMLLCKLVYTEKGEIVLELKNGKRSEQIAIKAFIEEINDFIQDCASKLHIGIE